MRARLASEAFWANTENRSARTAAARAAHFAKFEAEVDPDGKLPPAERARRAEHARRAHMLRLALKSSRAAQRRRSATDDEAS